MNRAVGRRAMFENDRDVERFLKRLAGAVEKGWIEVHVFVVLHSHFHLLLLSLLGQLSAALHFLQGPYAQWFNRSRERDGPIHRGRFLAKRVDCDVYQRRLVSYIDGNPVIAELSRTPSGYKHGSARWFARRTGPAWHTRTWVEREVCERVAKTVYDPADYARAFPPLTGDPAHDPITRARVQDVDCAKVDFLMNTADEARAAWLRDLAHRADGTDALRPIASMSTVRGAIAALNLPTQPIRATALAILLRKLAGATLAEVARELGCSTSTARRLVASGATLLKTDPGFAAGLSRAAGIALDDTYGPWQKSARH